MDEQAIIELSTRLSTGLSTGQSTKPSPDRYLTVTGLLPDCPWTVTGPLPDHHKTVSHIILQILTSYLIKMHCALRFECLKPNKKEASNVKCQPDDFLQRF